MNRNFVCVTKWVTFIRLVFLKLGRYINDKQSLEIFSIHNSSAKGITT